MYTIYVGGELFCDSRVDELAIINPVIKLEVNKAGSFTFVIPPAHPFYDMLTYRDKIIEVWREDDEEPIFRGECMSYTDDIYRQRSVVCEGELTFLNDSYLRPASYSKYTTRALLNAYLTAHNSAVTEDRQFQIGIVTAKDTNDSITCFTNYETTMSQIKADLLDDIDGYLRIRHVDGKRYLDFLAESPRTAQQVIRLGENVLDYSSNLDATNVISVIIPLGAKQDTQKIKGLDDYLTIKSVNDDKDYLESADAVASFGYVEAVVKWDDVTEASNLKTKGQKYLTDAQFANVKVDVKAIDLHYDSDQVEGFQLLDKVRVISKPHGMDRYFLLSAMTINLNNPENDTFTLGTEYNASLTTRTVQENQRVLKYIAENEVDEEAILEQAKENATELINTGDTGYITTIKDSDGHAKELCIFDTPSKDTATTAWIFNNGGLGYYPKGYKKGTVRSAMTKDGAIVADIITAGTLQGITLKGNTVSGNTITGGTITGTTISGGTVTGSAIEVTGKYIMADDYDLQITKQSDGTWYIHVSGDIDADEGISAGGLIMGKTLQISGTKSRMCETDTYGARLLYCDETPTPTFTDFGDGETDSTGECYVFLDDIFAETIDLECDYQVFIQPYGEGAMYVSERNPMYFVVNGNPDTKFGWILKATQKEYDSMRLDEPEEKSTDYDYADAALDDVLSETDLDDLMDDLLAESEEENE